MRSTSRILCFCQINYTHSPRFCMGYRFWNPAESKIFNNVREAASFYSFNSLNFMGHGSRTCSRCRITFMLLPTGEPEWLIFILVATSRICETVKYKPSKIEGWQQSSERIQKWCNQSSRNPSRHLREFSYNSSQRMRLDTSCHKRQSRIRLAQPPQKRLQSAKDHCSWLIWRYCAYSTPHSV